jgi:transcriptional regulator NrdR family protein
VYNSRKRESSIYRRRKCLNCNFRFTTFETIFTPDVVEVAKKFNDDLLSLLDLVKQIRNSSRFLTRKRL